MENQQSGTPYLERLRGQIDLTTVPFSSQGSRLVLQQAPGRSSLQVRLGERLTELDPHPEAYLNRPPFIQSIQFIDQRGEPLPFESNASPDILIFQTQLGKFKLAFADEDTLAIGLPPTGAAGIRFHVNSHHFTPGGAQTPIRSAAYTSNTEILQSMVNPDTTGALIEIILQPGLDRNILLKIGESPTLPDAVPPFSEVQTKAEKRWREWFSPIPPVSEIYADKYAYAWWVMGNNLISPRGCIRFESMAPSKISYIGLWLWDNAFHALALRHVNPQLARDQIRAFLGLQRPDGMLPDAIFDDAPLFELDHPIPGEVTKPPILAWAALKVHEIAPDVGFLREIYPALARLNTWWFQHNDPQHSGLAQYFHPYSSGLDDSPLWDHGMPVESPDLNTYLYISMRSLARMARVLRLRSEAILWEQGAEMLVQRMLDRLWDEESGVFRTLHNGEPVPVITPLNLLPLWTGRLPARITTRLLSQLTNKRKFWGGFMLPTVARDDRSFDSETMWRGPVWANINYLFIEALTAARKKELASQLCSATLDLIMSQSSIYEYYSAETGRPPARSAPAFGWTAALFVDLALRASREQESGDSA